MITSVTSATVGAASDMAGLGATLGAGGAILVIGLLVAMDLLGASQAPRLMGVRKLLLIITGPLVLVFVVSVAAKAMAILAAQT